MPQIPITASSDLDSLGAEIRNPARTRPVVVVVARTTGGFPFDVDHIVDELGDYSDIYTITESVISARFSAAVGQNLMAPEGIAAVWGAVSLGDDGLRFSFAPQTDTANGVFRATGRIVGEARTMAYRSGVFDRPSESAVSVRGIVSTMFAGSALIKPLGNAQGVSIPPVLSVLEELTFPGVPMSWYLSVGQEVAGTWDPESRSFTLDKSVWTARDVVDAYPYGSVTLGMVTAVDRQVGRIAIHPSLPIEVSRAEISSNPRDLVNRLLSVGDIVRVRVYRNSQGDTRVRLDDIDDSEEVLAPPVLVSGGQPWLEQEHNAILEQLLKQFEEEPTRDADLRDAMNELFAKWGVDADLDLLLKSIIDQSPDAESLGSAPGSLTADAPNAPEGAVANRAPVDNATVAGATVARPVPGARVVVPTSTGVITVPPAVHAVVAESPPGRVSVQQASIDAFAIKRMRADLSAAIAVRDRIQNEYGSLVSELAEAKQAITLLRADRTDLRAKLSDIKKDNSRLQQQTSTIMSRRERFASDSDWLREEIRRTWLAVFKPSDRDVHNIDSERWEFGDHFVDTFVALDAGEQRKALRVIVAVVSRRNARENVHHEHPLRTGDSASAPELKRLNGDACWRVHLEKGVAQAKRLHYWRRKDGCFELARIADHDVYEA